MSAEYFLVPRLVWEDICLHIQASEIEELRWVIGNYLIDDNVQLKQELVLLLEILSEYQRQSDEVRESLLSRSKSRAPEPPGRALLVEKLKILATDIVHSANGVANTSSREEELIKYVLSVGENANCGVWSSAVTTPRIAEAAVVSPPQSAREVVLLRPCTGYGCRPSTASSLCRPESRGSTSSICSTVSSIIESPEIRKCLNFVDIDSIREEVQGALLEEKQQLLEDIEFIQSCIDMEKELLDDDRRRVISVKPPPALQELQDLSRTLERTLHQQDSFEQVQAIVRKADPLTNGHRSLQKLLTAPTLPTSPRPLSPEFFDNQYLSSRRLSKDGERISCSQDATTRKRVTRRVQSIRYTIQEARDEPFLT